MAGIRRTFVDIDLTCIALETGKTVTPEMDKLRWISSNAEDQAWVETVREFIRYTIRYSIKGENSIISPDCNLKLKNPIAQSPS